MKTERRKLLALLCCIGLLALYAVTAHLAWSGKSATFDEPLNLVSAWSQVHDGDFRIDPEEPPLYKYYIAGGTSSSDLLVDQTHPLWNRMLTAPVEGDFSREELYGRSGADELIAAARARMIFLSIVLGGLIAWCAWRCAGPLGGVVATAAFALDPSFLAHGALVKSDAPAALTFMVLTCALWLLCERATFVRILAVCVAVGIAVNVKFSGLLALPILAVALAIRATCSSEWTFLGRSVKSRVQRAGIGAGVLILALLVTYLMIWACYDFRFSPGQNSGDVFDMRPYNMIVAQREVMIAHGSPITAPTLDVLDQWTKDWQPHGMVRFIDWLNDKHLFPQAWLAGFLFIDGTSMLRPTFLCGQLSSAGWWYYFPLAMAFKTPLSTLVALLLSATLFWWWRDKSGKRNWATFGILAVCPAIYMIFAMRSHLNIGIRHILPVYPFLFILIGVAAARSHARWPRAAAVAISTFLIGLAIETFSAFPNYIPFFNAAVGDSSGGIRLLSDSNIDWGQELIDLGKWQQENPGHPLFVCLFGSVDPSYYKINFQPMGPESLATARQSKDAVFAISAVALQGVYLTPERDREIEPFRHCQPFAVLGGSVYLFQTPHD